MNGLSPWPGCRVRVGDGGVVTLLRAAVGGPTGGLPGTISEDGIVAGDGRRVVVLDVQPEGGRPMPLADFRRGRPWIGGIAVTSVA